MRGAKKRQLYLITAIRLSAKDKVLCSVSGGAFSKTYIKLKING